MTKLRTMIVITCLFLLSGCMSQRGFEVAWQDKQIEMDIAGLVAKAPYKGALRVSAMSYNGELIIAGQAADEALLSRFNADLQQIAGLQHIYNRITVEPLADLSTVSRDTWITGRVKSAMIADNNIDSGAVRVMTEAGNVYLIGQLPEQAIPLAAEKARHVDGVKQVYTIIHALPSAIEVAE